MLIATATYEGASFFNGTFSECCLYVLHQQFGFPPVDFLNFRVPQQLLDSLSQIVLSSNASSRLLKTISAYILSEIAPKKDIHVLSAVGNQVPWDHRQIPYIFWVAANQVMLISV